MPRDLPVGNGSLLVAFDASYRIADFYYPRVGMENHAATRFRFGVWADGLLRWIEEPQWTKSLGYLRETLVTDVHCDSDEMGLRLRCYDTVDAESNVFVRKIVVRNQRNEARKVKLFFHHDFNIYGNPVADTAMFDPESRSIIHYKARRYFLINVATDSAVGVSEYNCGRSGVTGTDGTWRDAEDGVLSMSPIAQGAVDSTIGVTLSLEAQSSTTVTYWICAGKRYGEVRQLDKSVREETAARVISRTASYWYTWVNKTGEDLSDLPDEILELYKRSLLIINTQIDRGGAVLAGNDSDIQWGHNDHYSYMWPRDSAFVCDALDRAGFPELTTRFLHFAHRLIKDDGYFLHKYNPDGSLASLWHPWIRNGKPQLPIQEDETALVIWLVARHYARTRDLELTRGLYRRLVAQPAEFLIRHRDPKTSLPYAGMDMWEERQGIFTFTCATVVAGLTAAAELANVFNEQERRARYQQAAKEVRDAMVRHLWLEDEGRFARGLVLDDQDELQLDKTIDSSVFATFYLGVFSPTSAMVEGSMAAVREKLWVQTEVGGMARYENDAYHRISEETARVPGNPWIISTLWYAEHAMAKARSVLELQSALDLVRWGRAKASPSLVLPEQVDPYDGQALSVAPLTWSHAQVVSVVRGYLDARRELRQNGLENASKFQLSDRPADPVDKP